MFEQHFTKLKFIVLYIRFWLSFGYENEFANKRKLPAKVGSITLRTIPGHRDGEL